MGRMNEKDCLNEITIFENYSNNLSSKFDNYNLFSNKLNNSKKTSSANYIMQ